MNQQPKKMVQMNNSTTRETLFEMNKSVRHTVINVRKVDLLTPGATKTFPSVDIGKDNGIFEFEFTGTVSHIDMDITLQVSQDNIEFFDFPNVFTKLGLNIYSKFDMIFQYHRVVVVNSTPDVRSITYIESGRH